MIELIYNEEVESTTEEKAIPEPKNVKQVGEPKDYKKIFIEDYVHNFLMQYSAGEQTESKTAILLGKQKRAGGKRYLYIQSALPVEPLTEKQGKYLFSEKMWGTIYQECEKYFPEQEILGWFLAKPGFPIEKTSVLEETHRTYFSGADKVLFMMEPMENDSGFFGFDGNRFCRQPGYYIYYEKNEPMREFLMMQNETRDNHKESEKKDVAVANFRRILREKQEKNVKRKKRALSYGMKVAISLVFFVGAVALKNQTDKIRTMEQKINEMSGNQEIEEAVSDEVLVEELPGNVEENIEGVKEEPMAPEVFEEEQPMEEHEEKQTEEEQVNEEEQEQINKEGQEEEQVQINEEEQVQETAAETPVYEEYVVQAGDTLANISRKRYGTDEMVEQICKLNEIMNGDYIQEGEIILLP